MVWNSVADISSNSVSDADDMKKEPNLFRKPRRPDRSTAHTLMCVPDAAAQMIGNANNDSCRTASIVPYKERLGEFNNCYCLHLENLVITCTSSFFGRFPVFPSDAEAALFSAHPSSLRGSFEKKLKTWIRHYGGLTLNLKVYSKINNRLLIGNISDHQISAYVCQTAIIPLAYISKGWRWTMRETDLTQTQIRQMQFIETANMSSVGGKGGVLSKYREIK